MKVDIQLEDWQYSTRFWYDFWNKNKFFQKQWQYSAPESLPTQEEIDHLNQIGLESIGIALGDAMLQTAEINALSKEIRKNYWHNLLMFTALCVMLLVAPLVTYFLWRMLQ